MRKQIPITYTGAKIELLKTMRGVKVYHISSSGTRKLIAMCHHPATYDPLENCAHGIMSHIQRHHQSELNEMFNNQISQTIPIRAQHHYAPSLN